MSSYKNISSASRSSQHPQLWSGSTTYISFEAKEKSSFDWWSKKQRHNPLLQKSPFLPKTWKEYLAHRQGMLDDKIVESNERIAARVGAKRIGVEVLPGFGGKNIVPLPSLEGYFAWRRGEKPERVVDHTGRSFEVNGAIYVGQDLMRRL